MTSTDQPRTATAALRDLLEQFHGRRLRGGVVHRAQLEPGPGGLTARLNELAALERADTDLADTIRAGLRLRAGGRTDDALLEAVHAVVSHVRNEAHNAPVDEDRAVEWAVEHLTRCFRVARGEQQ